MVKIPFRMTNPGIREGKPDLSLINLEGILDNALEEIPDYADYFLYFMDVNNLQGTNVELMNRQITILSSNC